MMPAMGTSRVLLRGAQIHPHGAGPLEGDRSALNAVQTDGLGGDRRPGGTADPARLPSAGRVGFPEAGGHGLVEDGDGSARVHQHQGLPAVTIAALQLDLHQGQAMVVRFQRRHQVGGGGPGRTPQQHQEHPEQSDQPGQPTPSGRGLS